jgi:hypothetical protein
VAENKKECPRAYHLSRGSTLSIPQMALTVAQC